VALFCKAGDGLEVEDSPDRWAPPVGDHVREREGSGALAGPLMGQKKTRPRREGRGRGNGPRVDRFGFFLFFSFKSFSNRFQTFLNQIFFTKFSNFFTNIFKTFSQLF
jgi:hypothetical protein